MCVAGEIRFTPSSRATGPQLMFGLSSRDVRDRFEVSSRKTGMPRVPKLVLSTIASAARASRLMVMYRSC
ncbi:hypothetical protein [Streptosporangium minutum]|uniref:Uncharacterized protein n=1 Tax=Streptosporangium minutum TaxID=569862 RepID=A0A243RI03_9ACTN|nr:hypothetical protein [Streptosporangium minutum]OUC94448.1 hypothetical protein CA984_22305 [Streptosporangium minutum]